MHIGKIAAKTISKDDSFQYITREGGVSGAVKGATCGIITVSAYALGTVLAGSPIGWTAYAAHAAIAGIGLGVHGAKRKR